MGFGKDGKGVILRETNIITLSTLGAAAAIKAASNIGLQEDFRLIKTEFFVFQTAMTADEYVIIGISDTELSAAEVAQSYNVDGPVDRNDNLANEQSHRPVWPICIITEGGTGSDSDLPGGGLPIEKTIRWTFSDTEGFTFHAFNPGTAALTTGGVIHITAKHYGVWVT